MPSGSKDRKKSVERRTSDRPSIGFTAEERAAMRERAQELRAASARPRGEKEDPEEIVRAKIATFPGSDRALGEKIHNLVKANAPNLKPRLWYGMPAYSNADGEVVCFFQNASKFKTRYATLGFSDEAKLDDGQMWPTVYALQQLTPEDEARIAALIRKAIA